MCLVCIHDGAPTMSRYQGTLADFGVPTATETLGRGPPRGIAFCAFAPSRGSGEPSRAGYVCTVAHMDAELFRAHYLAAEAGLAWSSRMHKWAIVDAGEAAAAPYAALLTRKPSAGEYIFLCSYAQPHNAVPYEPSLIAAIPLDARIGLLFQYIFAMHQIYTLFGVQATHTPVGILKRDSGQSWDYWVRRRGGEYDRFTPGISDYQLQFGELNLAPTSHLTYGGMCSTLFPDEKTNPSIMGNALLLACLDYLRHPGDEWSAQNGFKWGPCMLLFYPLFASYNPSMLPSTGTPPRTAVIIEQGYLHYPLKAGEQPLHADGGAQLARDADALYASIAASAGSAAAAAAQEAIRKATEEQQRLAQEEAARKAAEKAAQDEAERQRLADEKAARDAAEKQRLADEKAARDEVERQRLAKEKADQEAAQRAAEAETARIKTYAASVPAVLPFVQRDNLEYWRLYDQGVKGAVLTVGKKPIPSAWFASTDPRTQKRLQAAVFLASGAAAGDANARRKAMAISQINV